LKRVYFCAALFAVLLAFSGVCGVYVKNKIEEVREAVELAEQNCEDGDFEKASYYAEFAVAKWDGFCKKTWLLSNRQLVAEITASLARIDAIVYNEEDGALQECAAAKKFIEHLLCDNFFKFA